MLKNFFVFVLELLKIIIISLVIIIPVRYFLIQPFYVKGASMEPNFYNNEYLIIDEITYRLHQPQRGDIIVFRYPKDPQEYFIKRVIGLPGEEVQIKDGGIMIFNSANPNGSNLKETYLDPELKTNSLTQEKIALGNNEYYVLGDNRNQSKDSRSFGPVDKSFIIGRVLFRGWPFNRVTVFETPQYGLSATAN
jgi:signal peptidase I